MKINLSLVKKNSIKLGLIIILLMIVGLSVVDKYGICSDEKLEINMVFWNINLVAKGKPIPWDLKYYGTLFNFTSEAIFKGTKIIKNISIIPPKIRKESNQNIIENRPKLRFYERIKLKHKLTFLISVISYISVAGMVGILAGWEYAWLGPVVLALFPRFWGHSFFNPKDVPFAAMFTLGTYLGSYLVGYYLKTGEPKVIRLGINRLTLFSLLYGTLVGLVSGTRIAGCFLLFFVALTHLIISLRKNTYRYFFRFISLYGLMLIAWMITITIIHPASWSNPFRWLWDTFRYLAKHGWSGNVLFEGKFIVAQSLPWYYLPKWIAITTPFIFQIAFFVGLLLILFKYSKFTEIQCACVILILLQVFFLPILAIIKQSTIYDGIRQFLFIIPGIAAIAATSIIWIYQEISNRRVKLFVSALIVVLFLQIIFDMVALHPYEYIYFNRISGGLAKAHNQYDTDYWGLSMREGMEWINKNLAHNTTVVSSSQLHSSSTFAAPDITVISTKASEQKGVERPFYYISRPRWQLQQKFPDCKIVYEVVRQGVPLTIVKKCE